MKPRLPEGENTTTNSEQMSLKGVEAFLRSHVPVQVAIRKLLESGEPLPLMKLNNFGPREGRKHLWPALEALREGGVLVDSEQDVVDVRTLTVSIAAKYRTVLARVVQFEKKKEQKTSSAEKPRKGGRDEWMFNDPNNLLALKLLLECPGAASLNDINERSGLVAQQKRHGFWSKMRERKWMKQNDLEIELTASGKKAVAALVAQLGHLIPAEWLEDEA